MSAQKKVHVLFHDAGGGHRNAAVALKAVSEQQGRPWDLNLVQFQELTDHLDVLRRLTGIRIQEQYNILLRNGWTWGSEYLLRVLQLTIRIFHRPMVKLLAKYWRENPADLLISVIPHFNREIAESLQIAEKTVRIHVSGVLEKLGARDRTQAAIYAIQRGIVHFE